MKRERLTEKFAASSEKEKKDKRDSEGRNIGDFEYNKSKAKILQKALHNINVSLGTLLAAMKDLSILRGSDVTPDGKLGGSGFIMSFREIKTIMAESINSLSNVTDTIADELTNPRWGLTDKEKKKVEEIQENVEDKAEVADNIVEERKTPEETPEEIKEEEVSISPEDVITKISPAEEKIDTTNQQSIDRYRELLDAPTSSDKTASTLRKYILANIVRK